MSTTYVQQAGGAAYSDSCYVHTVRAVIMKSFFSKIVTIDTPSLAREGEVLGVSCDLISDSLLATVIAVWHVLSWEIRPRYNDIGMYHIVALAQACCNSIVNALVLPQYCAKPWYFVGLRINNRTINIDNYETNI